MHYPLGTWAIARARPSSSSSQHFLRPEQSVIGSRAQPGRLATPQRRSGCCGLARYKIGEKRGRRDIRQRWTPLVHPHAARSSLPIIRGGKERKKKRPYALSDDSQMNERESLSPLSFFPLCLLLQCDARMLPRNCKPMGTDLDTTMQWPILEYGKWAWPMLRGTSRAAERHRNRTGSAWKERKKEKKGLDVLLWSRCPIARSALMRGMVVGCSSHSPKTRVAEEMQAMDTHTHTHKLDVRGLQALTFPKPSALTARSQYSLADQCLCLDSKEREWKSDNQVQSRTR